MLPWQDTTAHNEREAFIAAWQEGEETVAALAQHFGVSRKTGPQVHQPLPRGGRGRPPRPQPRPARAPQRHTPRGSRPPGVQAKRADAALGPKKLVPPPPSRLSPPPLVRSQHRGRHPRSGRSRPPPEASAPRGPVARPLPASHPPQRLLVHRLQGLGPHRRRRPHRPPHHPGRPLPLPARLSGAAPSRLPPGPSRLRAHLPRAWTAPRHPLRQRPAFRQHRPRRPESARRLVRQARRHP